MSKAFNPLRPVLFGLALTIAMLAQAEPLVLVTANRIALHDSANVAVQQDAVSYALPSGFSATGADYDPDDQRFYVLGRNAETGLCGVYFVDVENAPDNGPAAVSTNIPTVACSAQATDLEFIRSGQFDAGLLIADGSVLLSYDSEARAWETVPVSNGNQTTPRVLALALRGVNGVMSQEAITGNGDGQATLHDFTGSQNGVSLSNPRILQEVMGRTSSDAFVVLPIAYDVGEDSGSRFLLASGKVFAVGAEGSAVLLGAAPQGTLALAVPRSTQNPVESDNRTFQTSDNATPLRLGTTAGRFESARGATQPSLAPDRETYPYGWVAFKIVGLTAGQTVQVTITPQGQGPTATEYIKCPGSGGPCFPFQGTTFSGGVATLTITDGGPGDDDGIVNGEIADPGALALPVSSMNPPAPVQPPTLGSRIPADGGGVFGLWSLVLLLLVPARSLGRRIKQVTDSKRSRPFRSRC